MKTKETPAAKPTRRTRSQRESTFEAFAAEFGPKPGEKPGKRAGKGGAVDFLIKLRRGKA